MPFLFVSLKQSHLTTHRTPRMPSLFFSSCQGSCTTPYGILWKLSTQCMQICQSLLCYLNPVERFIHTVENLIFEPRLFAESKICYALDNCSIEFQFQWHKIFPSNKQLHRARSSSNILLSKIEKIKKEIGMPCVLSLTIHNKTQRLGVQRWHRPNINIWRPKLAGHRFNTEPIIQCFYII